MGSKTYIYEGRARPRIARRDRVHILISNLIHRILNKITPEKFQKLSQKLVDVFSLITAENIYVEAVGLVFMKACSEPSFSKMYAELCTRLGEIVPKANQEVTILFNS